MGATWRTFARGFGAVFDLTGTAAAERAERRRFSMAEVADYYSHSYAPARAAARSYASSVAAESRARRQDRARAFRYALWVLGASALGTAIVTTVALVMPTHVGGLNALWVIGPSLGVLATIVVGVVRHAVSALLDLIPRLEGSGDRGRTRRKQDHTSGGDS